MATVLAFEYTHKGELPAGHTDEFRTPEALVEHFLEEYSETGDKIIDIFAGCGTTLKVAEQLNRVPYGVEYEPDLASYIQNQIETPDHIRQADVLNLDSSWFPSCDCCFTSPPFMERTDNRNPFQNYSGQSTYKDYLNDIETAFTRLDSVLAPGGHLIVDIANMKCEGRVTPLAWDVAERISNVFDFDGEIVIRWEGVDSPDKEAGPPGFGYNHSYCLMFQKADT